MNNLFQISNHPIAQNVQRKIRVIGVYPNFIEQSVRCPFILEHYIDNVLDEKFFKNEFASLFTTNQKYVNQEGQRVQLIEESYLEEETQEEKTRLVPPVNSIPEFDYLFSYVAQQNKSLGEIILDVIAFMVARNDQAGNFNDMANFRE